MKNLIFESVISILYCCYFSDATCPIPYHCNNSSFVDSNVEKYCKQELVNSTMIGRCCFTNLSIVGLDLRYCEVQVLNLTVANFTDLAVMDMRNNDFSIITSQFIGLKNLERLYLPENYTCPGGKDAWNETHGKDTECLWQRDPCSYLNISCTENGACEHVGPGSMICNCQPGHYGYKCLNSGNFPTTTFLVSTIVSTVVLSVVLWFAVGRDVKLHSHL